MYRVHPNKLQVYSTEAFYFFELLECFLMISMRLLLVTMVSLSSRPPAALAFCFSLLCCSWRWGELMSCGGSWEPVGLTRFTTSRNRRLLLLFRNVIAVPLWPSLPALPTWGGRCRGREERVEVR